MSGVRPIRGLSLSLFVMVGLSFPAQIHAQRPSSDQLLEEGNVALRAGRLSEAAEKFTQVTVAAPQFAAGFFDLGLVRVQQGKWEDAIEALHKCVQLDPKFRGVHLFLGIAEYRRNQYSNAEKALKREIELTPKNPDALMWLGVVQLVEDKIEEAAGNLDRAAALKPSDTDILYHQGRAHMLLSQQIYERMYKIDSNSWRIHQVLAQSFVEQERYDDAVRECQLAIQDHSTEPGLHEELGDIYWKQNQLESAEAAFREELKVDPDNVSALYKLGTITLERSKAAEAEEILTRVLRSSPDSIEAHYQLGRAEAQLARYDQAIANFSFVTANGARADQDILRQSFYQLSQVYRRAQKPEESKKALEVFLSMKQDADARQDKKLQDKLKRATNGTAGDN